MELSVFLPIVQAFIVFHSYRLLAIRLPDDRDAVSMRALCRTLGMDLSDQLKRIQRDPNFAGQLVMARIQTPRGPRYAYFLIAEAIPLWLVGLHFNKIAPEKRPLFFALHVEIVQTVHRALSQTETAPESPTAPAPEASPQRLNAPHARRPGQARSRLRRHARPSGERTELDDLKATVLRLEKEAARGRQEQEIKDAQQQARDEWLKAELADLKLRLAALEGASQASGGPARQEAITWADLEEVIGAVHALGIALDRRDEAMQGRQRTAEAHVAQVQQGTTALEGAWARLYVQVVQMQQTLRELSAKPLASESQVIWVHQMITAVVAELWKIKERLDALHPPPPAGLRQRGRPRPDQLH